MPTNSQKHLEKEQYEVCGEEKCPLLKKAHRKARLDWALKYQHWTVESWMMVGWTDKTKINKIGSNGRLWTWKRVGEPLKDRTNTTTVKHGGGSIMVWGLMG